MAAPLHQQSEAWVKAIAEEKGYTAIDASTFRRFLARMPSYAFYKGLSRHVRPGMTALEAGCGWGLSSFALASRGVKVTAVDISDKLVADLQRVQAELGGAYATNLRVLVWDIFCLAEIGSTYDVVFSDGTYEHFLEDENRQAILRNVAAVLKSGGNFVVAVPNLHNPFFRLVVDQKMPAMKYFTVNALAKELENGGFTVLDMGFSFVNPGFEQWVKSRWMIGVIRLVNAIFPLLPRFLKKIFAAHVYCVAKKS